MQKQIALLEVDKYLRRRCAFNALQEDMVVTGVVNDKTPTSVTVVLSSVHAMRSNSDLPYVKPPRLSSLSSHLVQRSGVRRSGTTDDERYDPFIALHELQIVGVCHMLEMNVNVEAPVSNSSRKRQSSSSSIVLTSSGAVADSEDSLSGSGGEETESLQPAAKKKKTGGSVSGGAGGDQQEGMHGFGIGDQVKALIISVDSFSEKVYLSLNNDRLAQVRNTTHVLGLCPDAEKIQSGANSTQNTPTFKPGYIAVTPPPFALQGGGGKVDHPHSSTSSGNSPSYPSYASYSPRYPQGQSATSNTSPANYGSSPLVPGGLKLKSSYSSGPSAYTPLQVQDSSSPGVRHNYSGGAESGGRDGLLVHSTEFNELLEKDPLFKNPEGIYIMLKYYDIEQHNCFLSKSLLGELGLVPEEEHMDKLRAHQNLQWANQSYDKGVSMYKAKEFDNALRCYNHALSIDGNFAPAHVGIGAMHVNDGLLKKAIASFETALRLDPDVKYAQGYLNGTRMKLQALQEQRAADKARTKANGAASVSNSSMHTSVHENSLSKRSKRKRA
jgi:hypothetical protein